MRHIWLRVVGLFRRTREYLRRVTRNAWFRVAVFLRRTRKHLPQIMRTTWLRAVVILHRTRKCLRRTIRSTWFKVAVILALILSPIGIGWIYRRLTAFPENITIPIGPEGGRHEQVSESLRGEISKRVKVKTDRKVQTDGSLQNLRLLQEGQIDFAIYQAGTEEALGGLDVFFDNRDKNDDGKLNLQECTAQPSPDEFKGEWSVENAERAFDRLDKNDDGFLSPEEYKDTSSIASVANLYSDVVHVFVRGDAGIQSTDDLRDHRVALGAKASGDYGMSLILLEHFGLDERTITPEYLKYPEIEDKFEHDELDAAFITMGIKEPVFPRLFDDEKCDLLEIPCAESLTKKHLSMSPYTIPRGHYRSQTPARPATEIETVAVNAQLLTRSDVHVGLVEEVTRLVMSEDFLKKHNLRELFDHGREFAREKPEFAIHPGAQNFFEPELKPLLPAEFVESTEGMRQFAVSILIAVFFGVRWLRQRSVKKKERKLNRFIRSLLDIERQLVSLDAGVDAKDVEALQELLREVIFLRQEALREFSAQELNEVRAVECFIEMSHDLSNKINAKISRQRLDKRFDELADAISGRDSTEAPKRASKRAPKKSPKKASKRVRKKG